MMHVIICGGTDYILTPEDIHWLNTLARLHDIVKVLHGGAPGVDRAAKRWALSCGMEVQEFLARWTQEGISAGPRRNAKMLWYLLGTHGAPPVPATIARAVLAFPGNRGTADMVRKAHKAGVQVWEAHA